MASPNVVLEALSPPIKTGWFDSLKRTRKPKPSSSGLSSAKSLSSLNHSVQTASAGALQQLDQHTVQPQQPHQSRTWRAKFIKNRSPIKNSPPPPPETAAVTGASPSSAPFYTLPRKRPDQRASQPPASSPPQGATTTTTRMRSYSTAVLDRQTKRSTVWYTFSETDIRLKNNGVSVLCVYAHLASLSLSRSR